MLEYLGTHIPDYKWLASDLAKQEDLKSQPSLFEASVAAREDKRKILLEILGEILTTQFNMSLSATAGSEILVTLQIIEKLNSEISRVFDETATSEQGLQWQVFAQSVLTVHNLVAPLLSQQSVVSYLGNMSEFYQSDMISPYDGVRMVAVLKGKKKTPK